MANLGYGDAGVRNLLDVYHHRARPEGGPVLIHFHGGHYDQGRKDTQSLPLLYRLASRGWVCISANYRLRPASSHPDHLIDAKKVIAWAREHAAEYGAHPGAAVYVSGSSAGGHMAALAALTADDPAYQPGFEGADTSVTAAIVLNGYLGTYFDGNPATSPVNLVRPDAPPSSSPTATWTNWSRRTTPEPSSTPCAPSPPPPSSTPSSPAPTTPSTSSTPSASKPSSTASKTSPAGSAPGRPRPTGRPLTPPD
ncbi:alpha/beta hydrolase [Kitasatospora saccharophila]|uniref:alpha/beta hydrolase n=1 Tax=Kitasatospora saccharophila TaxID=407973 RepID=UPI00362F3112